MLPNFFFFLNYKVWQVEDVLKEEKSWTFFRTDKNFQQRGIRFPTMTKHWKSCSMQWGQKCVRKCQSLCNSYVRLLCFWDDVPMHGDTPTPRLQSDITQAVPDKWEAGHSPADGCQQKSCVSI